MAERAVKSSFVVNISSSVSAFQSSCTHRSLHISPQCLHPPAAGCHSTSIWLRKVNTGIFQPFIDCYSQTTYQHPNEDPVGILHNDPEVRVSSYQRTGTVPSAVCGWHRFSRARLAPNPIVFKATSAYPPSSSVSSVSLRIEYAWWLERRFPRDMIPGFGHKFIRNRPETCIGKFHADDTHLVPAS